MEPKSVLPWIYKMTLFAQIVSSLTDTISCYKALHWLFLAITIFPTAISSIIPWNIVFVYWLKIKYWASLDLLDKKKSFAVKR